MDEQLRGTAVFRARRRARVAALARTQDGLLSRRQVYAAGATRSEAKAEIRAGRWSAEGRHCLRIGPVNARQKWWRALLEVGAGAVLDGASALIHAGLRGVDERVVHVSVPKSSTPARSRGVRVHETRRYTPTRQVVRETPSGRRYYDVDFDPYGVSVEVDGAQHLDAAAAVPDALKQNEAVIGGRTAPQEFRSPSPGATASRRRRRRRTSRRGPGAAR
jgi:hypothetical protein